MKKKWTWSRILWATAAVALLVSGSTLFAAKGGGGKPGGGENQPPPVMYLLHRFTLPPDYLGGHWWVEEMNDVGELVGYYDDGVNVGGEQPCYLDTNTGDSVATNLNDLQFDEAYAVPDGWYIYAATGINNLGDISCALARDGDIKQLRGCVIEMRPDALDPSLKPRVHLIPDGAWSHTYARRINDVGVVLGVGDSDTSYVYRVPLHGQTGDESVTVIPIPFNAWYAFLTNPVNDGGPSLVKAEIYVTDEILTYNVDEGTWSFADLSNLGFNLFRIRGVNDLGSFCGNYSKQISKRKTANRGFAYDGVFVALDDMEFGDNLNNDGDVIGVTPGSRRPVLYVSEHGSFLLDDAVVAQSDEEQAIWDDSGSSFTPTLSERDASGFPVVAGTMQRLDNSNGFFYDGYVLFPIAAP